MALVAIVLAACEEDNNESPDSGTGERDGAVYEAAEAGPTQDVDAQGQDASSDADPIADSSSIDDASSMTDAQATTDAQTTMDATTDAARPDAGSGPVVASGCSPQLAPHSFTLDLGLTGSAQIADTTSSRILAFESGVWRLWESSNFTRFTSGTGYCSSCAIEGAHAMRGDLLLTKQTNDNAGTIELYRASTGQIIGWRTERYSFGGVANDGSYAYMIGASVQVYSPSPALLHTTAKSISSIEAIEATPAILYLRSNNTSQIQAITIATGVTASFTYSGQFISWFGDDSGRFLTSAAGAIRIYGADGTQQRLASLASGETVVGAFGDFYWTSSASGTTVRRLSDDSVALTAQGTPVQFRDGVLLLLKNKTDTLPYVDFRGSTPTSGQYSLILPNDARVGQLTLLPTGGVLIRDQRGAGYAVDGVSPMQAISCGPVLDAELTTSGVWAVLTANGELRTGSLATGTMNPVIDAGTATRLELAPDGAHLLAFVTTPEVTTQMTKVSRADVFAVSSGVFLRSLTIDSSYRTTRFVNSGQQIGTIRCPANLGCDVVIETPDGSPVRIWHAAIPTPPGSSMHPYWTALSPSGNRAGFAVDNGAQLYENGTLTGAASNGVPLVWLSEDRLLNLEPGISGGGGLIFGQGRIVNPTGTEITRTNRPFYDYNYRNVPTPKYVPLSGGAHILFRGTSGEGGRIYETATATLFYGTYEISNLDVAAANGTHALVGRNGLLSYAPYP